MPRDRNQPWRGRGRGRGGRAGTRGGRSGRGGGGASNGGPCYHFQRGTCTFGDSCRYSHDIAPVSEETRLVQEQYYDWKRHLGFESYRGAYRRIWHETVEILNGEDREIQQLLAKDLVHEEKRGFEIVKETLEADQDTDQTRLSIATAFLEVITHPALLDCLSIEPFVGTLYTFIGGSGGDRGIAYFSKLCVLLERLNTSIGLGNDAGRIFLLILRAIHELLSREQRALHNDRLSPLLGSLDQLVEKLQLDETSGARVEGMRRMFKNATRLITATPSQGASTAGRATMLPTFPLQMEVPGGRHDNDFLDASQIEILPTAGEIRADRSDYLPTTDFLRPHFSSSNQTRYLDTAIRLLRHDLFGSLKEDLYGMLSNLAEGVHPSKLLRETQTRTYVYAQAQVSHLLVDRRRGVEAQVTFAPPTQIQGKKKGKPLSRKDQARWWRDSPRFSEGALACLVAVGQGNRATEMLFLVFTEKNAEMTKDSKKSHLVPEDHRWPSIKAKLATQTADNLQTLVRWHGEGVRGVLVDLPGLIPATFASVIANLQKKLRQGELPFGRWIVPPDVAMASRTNGSVSACTGMPPPEYARRPGFAFSLDSIAQEGTTGLSVDPTAPHHADLGLIEKCTGLDRGQCEGLVAALTREYALIQGPPGTGKSFLGVKLLRVLLAHKHSRSLGPVMVICYTNHALDQFLKYLLDAGVKKIIRIGGQSRMPELDGLNLRVVGREQSKTRVEGQQVGQAYSELDNRLGEAGRSLAPLHRARCARPSWEVLDRFLQRENQRIHSQFHHFDEDGYQQVGRSPFDQWLGEDPHRSDGGNADGGDDEPDVDLDALSIQAERNVHLLHPAQRWALARSWMSGMRQAQAGRLFHTMNRAKEHQQTVDDVHDEVHRRVLLAADVIGVTTTGLARHMEMLQRVRCKVVVCEEAGEVMEPHMAASALLPGVEHLVQIGDHRQLRPQIANFSLSLESSGGQAYQLDRSQFERRAEGEPGMAAVGVAQLNVQRRMRPEISALIRGIYPRLEDHQSVRDHPDVVGMANNVFWLDHDHLEDGDNDEGHNTKSHSNEWEVGMTRALVRHLVLQGTYRADDIAVLTPYTGQLQKLRTALAREFELVLSDRDQEALAADGFERPEAAEKDDTWTGKDAGSTTKPLQKKSLADSLRLATVDNFQGEEAKVVVVSLVRANRQGRVGFLRTENRINVLVSRAQHGLFLLGHASTYLKVPMWARIHAQLADADAVGTALRLACPRHSDSTTMACATPDDFVRYSPEGGCARQCDLRLERCGHRCKAKCHASGLHEAYSCPQPCPRVRKTCEHACVRLCGDDCGQCMVKLDGVTLPCGHVQDGVACFEMQNLHKVVCRVEVRKKVPGCGHEIVVACHEQVASASFHCPVRCEEALQCLHPCPGTCGSCRSEDPDGAVTLAHQPCRKPCGRPYSSCHHRCPKVCHEGLDCGSCREPCQVRCPHSACSQLCSQPCAPCIEPCAWSCSHQGGCPMPCAAPCERLPCDERCNRNLACGHRCPSLCGEECPEDYCPLCADDSKRGMRVDLLEMKTLAEIDVDETPIVVLGCGHAFTAESLDGTVGMSDVYHVDPEGRFTGLLDTTAGDLPMAAAVPTCPDCKCPVRQFATRRYNRVVNRAVMDETSRRFLIQGQSAIAALEKRLVAVEEALGETLREAVDGLRHTFSHFFEDETSGDALRRRYGDVQRLRRDANKLHNRVADANQPARKLFDAIITRRNQMNQLELGMSNLSISPDEAKCRPKNAAAVFDKQIPLGAQLMQIKVQCVLLDDQFRLLKKAKRRAVQVLDMPDGTPESRTQSFLVQCEAFIAEARGQSLPRLVLQASLCYARIASRAGSDYLAPQDEEAVQYRDTAKALLEEGINLCTQLKDVQDLSAAAEQMLGLFRGPRYETVTADEVTAIKIAMVSGPKGLNTHSGHWYNCENGHPFAIGECGMPMEEARCPECGSRIGGQSHRFTDGVSRATEMER